MEQPTEKELMESYLAQRKQLDQWIRHHPMFAHEIRRIKNQIDQMMNKRADLLIMYRQTRREHYLEQARITLLQAQNHLKTFSKLELLATLSKR
jgi:tRNA U34 5-carboxymethylaminomethyl modifying GTPase MnmE/TrmE